MVGEQVSHYTILEHLGGGGMGVVYKARDLRLERPVALKFLPPELTRDADAKSRFIHEARAASALDHTNICTIHDIDESADGRLFIAMAFYDGETVKKKIERGPLKLEEVLDIAVQVAEGLAKAHGAGMVHRDIKPANVMVTGDRVVKIVDFGLARLSGMTRITRAGTTVGTLGYMSPEQVRGEQADHRSDLWSLGVMIYEMVTGRRPFGGDYDNALVYSIMNAQPEPMTALRTGVPVELERITGKAMAKDPSERYQHADDLLVDLRHLRKEGVPSPQGAAVTSAAPRAPAAGGALRKSSRWKKAALGAVSVLGITGAFFVLKPVLLEDFVVSEPKPIAVISFANQTGDPSYDYLREAIPNLLITSLEQSRYLRVLTWERMRDLLKQMGKGNVERIDKDLGFELCRREGVLAIVVGSYVKAGETFATDVKVLDVNSKELLKSASARGDGVQSILTAQIDELSREIARGVGLSQWKVETAERQIAEVTTSSMDAYNYYLRGRLDLDRMYFQDARQFLERAVSLDSSFAMAYLYLANAHGSLFESAKQVSAIRKAKALSARAPEKERLLIEAQYATTIEKNPGRRLAILEQVAQKYPGEKRVFFMLSIIYQGQERLDEAERAIASSLALDPDFAAAVNQRAYLSMKRGRYEQAIQAFDRYASLSPGDANPFDSMGELHLRMGRLDESIAKYREAIRANPSFLSAYGNLAYVFALKEDYPEAVRWLDSALRVGASPGPAALAHAWKGVYSRLTGKYRQSAKETDALHDIVSKLETESTSYRVIVYWLRGLWHLDRGSLHDSRRHFEAFSEEFRRNRPSTPITPLLLRNLYLSLVELRQGRLDSVRSRMVMMKARVDSAESFRNTIRMQLGILEAELLLTEGLPDSAIRVYRMTPVAELSMTAGWALPMYNVPRLRDVVPRAFQRKGQLDSAIVEYERLLRVDPASNDRRLISPEYHYRLAKICEEAARSDRAEEEYTRFLELWKDADGDVPERLDAGKRLASLRKKLPT
jgi:tetratricopeptide (TPR) repeat protein